MASASLKTPPKPPADFDDEMKTMYRDSCARAIDVAGCVYKSDLPFIEMYCRSYARWKQVRKHCDVSGLYDERMRLNEILKFEGNLSANLRQTYRAFETSVMERYKASKTGTGEVGGRTGVRQTPSREGVPQVGQAKRAGSGGVSWLDDARKKSDKKAS